MSNFLEQLVNMYQGINKLAEPHVKRQKELKTDLQNERIFLNNQINQADTVEEINNLSSLLGKFENKARLSGNDEYSLELEYGDKKQNYNLADNAFNEAMQYQDLFESNPDEYAKDIIGMNWMDVQSEISNIQRIKEQMDNGTLSGYKYKGTQKTNENGEVVRNYSQASLTKAIDQRIINLNKQVSLLDDNPEIWEIIQEDGTMDEESKALFDKFKFDLISGTKAEFDTDYQGLITNSSKKYQHNENMWIKYNEIGQKLIGGPQSLSDLLPKDLDPNSPNAALYQTILGQAEAEGKSQLDWEWVEEQKQRYKDRADKFNRQHEILTGQQYQDDSPWAAPKNIPGLGVTPFGPQNQGASSTTQSNQLQQSSLPKNIDADQDGVPDYLDPDSEGQDFSNIGEDTQTEGQRKYLTSKNIKEINAEEVVSNLKPQYQETGNYSSASKKIKKDINQYNKDVQKLSTSPIKGNPTSVGSNEFMTGNSIENFFNWPKGKGGLGGGTGFGKAIQQGKGPYTSEKIPNLENIIGRKENEGNFTLTDLSKLETKYEEDLRNKDSLVKEYTRLRNSGVDKKDPKLMEMQSKINEIHQRWFAYSVNDWGGDAGVFTPVKAITGPLGITGGVKKYDWNLQLERSGDYKKGATSLYKFMNFLKARHNEELKNVEAQRKKIEKNKKRLS